LPCGIRAGVIRAGGGGGPISCSPPEVGIDTDSWGIDHGTLVAAVGARFPDADIPVVQLRVNATKRSNTPPGAGREGWRRFAIAACFIVASGNVRATTLRRIAWEMPDAAFDWARSFGAEVGAIMTALPRT